MSLFLKTLIATSALTSLILTPHITIDKLPYFNTKIHFIASQTSSSTSKIMGVFYFSEPLDYEYTQEDVNLLAEVMYHENYCNGDYVMQLTGSVVLNRVKCDYFPDTIHDVLYAPGQYATVPKFYTTEIPEHVYDLARDLLENGSMAPDNVLFQSMYPDLGSGWYYTENGEYFAYE